MIGYYRFLLAAGVLFMHLGDFSGGFARSLVTAFFILSGFLITLTLNRNYACLGRFYWHRFLRIYPLHVLVVVTVALMLFLGAAYGHIMAKAYGEPQSWVQAALLLFQKEATKYNPPAWTLFYELLFYLVAPFIVRHVSRIIAVALASIVILAYNDALYTLAYGFMIHGQGGTELIGIRGPVYIFSSIPWFMLGAGLYHVRTRLGAHVYPIALFLVAALVGHEYLPLFLDNDAPGNIVMHFYIVALTIWVALSWTDKEVWGSKFAGDLCYPVYMIHYPVILYYSKRVFVVTIALSVLWVLFDRKCVEPLKRLSVRRAMLNFTSPTRRSAVTPESP